MNRALMTLGTTVLMAGSAVQAEVQKAPQQSNRIVKTCSVEEGAVADATCRGFIIGVIDLTRLYATTGQVQPAWGSVISAREGAALLLFLLFAECIDELRQVTPG